MPPTRMQNIKSVTFVAFLFHFAVFSCHGYSSGAPPKACKSMEPSHRGSKPRTDSPPYEIIAETSGGVITVTIRGKQNELFQGFMVQARDNSNKDKIVPGTFSLSGQNEIFSKAVGCDDIADTWTQTNKSDKTEIQSMWMPPSGFAGEIIFRATVLQTFPTFWLNLETRPLYVSETTAMPTSGTLSNPVYVGCDKIKSCFGDPASCIRRQNCNILLTFTGTQSGVSYELYGRLPSDKVYISMGLSYDRNMGDDIVTSCIKTDNSAKVQHSWNYNTPGYGNELSQEKLFGDEVARLEDGNIYCQWRKPHETTVNGKVFNTQNETYFILLARGPEGQFAGKGKHDFATSSQNAVNLISIQEIEAAGKSALIKVHGSFMVIAWVGFVSIGIIMARYYKQVWGEQLMCDVKIWFAFHRGLMFISVILIIIAFIVIFVFRGGWNSEGSNPHAVLGVIATILAVIQPIGALLRPSPDSPKRPIFNWLHWSAGNVAHIIAIITIFFAVNLSAAQLSDGFYWTMTIFVIGYCIVHLILQAHTLKLEKKKSNEVKMVEIGNQNAKSSKDNQEFPGSKFRKIVIGVYAVFCVVIVIALISLVCK